MTLCLLFLYTYQSHYFEVCNYYNIRYSIYTINIVNGYIRMLKTMGVIMTYCTIPLLNTYVVSNPLLLFALALMNPLIPSDKFYLPRSDIQGQRAYKLLYVLKHVSKLSSRLIYHSDSYQKLASTAFLQLTLLCLSRPKSLTVRKYCFVL